MKVFCVGHDPSRLPAVQAGPAGSHEGLHPLTVGRECVVMSMLLMEDRLLYLVVNDAGLPRFHAAAYFDAFDAALPAGWRYRLGEVIRTEWPDLWLGVQSIWGYPEIVGDPRHRARLINGDAEAVAIFDAHFRKASAEGSSSGPTED